MLSFALERRVNWRKMKTLLFIASIVLSVACINATSDLVDETITTWGLVEGNINESIHIDSTLRQEIFIYPNVSALIMIGLLLFDINYWSFILLLTNRIGSWNQPSKFKASHIWITALFHGQFIFLREGLVIDSSKF